MKDRSLRAAVFIFPGCCLRLSVITGACCRRGPYSRCSGHSHHLFFIKIINLSRLYKCLYSTVLRSKV